MIKQKEQLLNTKLIDLQTDLTAKITAKGGVITGDTLSELANAIESIPTGGGKDIGGMIPKISVSRSTFKLQAPITPTFTHKLDIAFGGGMTFGSTENIEINIGG